MFKEIEPEIRQKCLELEKRNSLFIYFRRLTRSFFLMFVLIAFVSLFSYFNNASLIDVLLPIALVIATPLLFGTILFFNRGSKIELSGFESNALSSFKICYLIHTYLKTKDKKLLESATNLMYDISMSFGTYTDQMLDSNPPLKSLTKISDLVNSIDKKIIPLLEKNNEEEIKSILPDLIKLISFFFSDNYEEISRFIEKFNLKESGKI